MYNNMHVIEESELFEHMVARISQLETPEETKIFLVEELIAQINEGRFDRAFFESCLWPKQSSSAPNNMHHAMPYDNIAPEIANLTPIYRATASTTLSFDMHQGMRNADASDPIVHVDNDEDLSKADRDEAYFLALLASLELGELGHTNLTISEIREKIRQAQVAKAERDSLFIAWWMHSIGSSDVLFAAAIIASYAASFTTIAGGFNDMALFKKAEIMCSIACASTFLYNFVPLVYDMLFDKSRPNSARDDKVGRIVVTLFDALLSGIFVFAVAACALPIADSLLFALEGDGILNRVLGSLVMVSTILLINLGGLKAKDWAVEKVSYSITSVDGILNSIIRMFEGKYTGEVSFVVKTTLEMRELYMEVETRSIGFYQGLVMNSRLNPDREQYNDDKWATKIQNQRKAYADRVASVV